MSVPMFYKFPEQSEVGEIFPNSFSVIIPEATTNLIPNPSFELNTATGYAAAGGGSIVVTTAAQRRGYYGLRVTTVNNVVSGVYHAISLAAATTYTLSLDLMGKPGVTYRLRAVGDSGPVPAYKFVTGKGFWERVSLTFTPTVSENHNLYVEIYSPTSPASYFYTDGWQLEAKAYATTYCDGDLTGFVPGQICYAWAYTPHGSPSTRTAFTNSGGREMKLSDLGFRIMAVVGLGLMPIANVALPRSTGGAYYQDSIPAAREFYLAGGIFGATRNELDRVRHALEQAITPLAGPFRQPLVLRYTPCDDCGLITGEPLDLRCVYKSGLEGAFVNPTQERAALQFQMFLPYIVSDHVAVKSLGWSNALGTNSWAYQFVNGEWTAFGTDLNGEVTALKRSLNNTLYMGGSLR